MFETLTELPLRMRSLARDAVGVPMPWFAAWRDGGPAYRADPARWLEAVRENMCWICGQHLGQHAAFVLAPLAAITRIGMEPPSHRQCAVWRAVHEPEGWAVHSPWPGVQLVYLAETYTTHKDGRGDLFINLGEPVAFSWWRQGRAATREEVVDSIEAGFIDLEYQANHGGWDNLAGLYRRKAETERFYPGAPK